MNAPQVEPRFSEELCCVCRRPAQGYGYSKNAKTVEQVAFVCDDLDCITIARETYHMKQLDFGRVDTMATEDGGTAAGEYLDSIGKTDLAQLTAGEWAEFCRKMVGGYRAALKGRLKGEAPF